MTFAFAVDYRTDFANQWSNAFPSYEQAEILRNGDVPYSDVKFHRATSAAAQQ
jgi:hypothetical protein